MATDYPDAVDSLPRPTAATAMNASGFEGDVVIDNISDAIEAVQTELGTNPAGSESTVAARLSAIEARLTIVEGEVLPPAAAIYGTALNMDTRANLLIGGGDDLLVDYFFTAEQSSTLTTALLQYIHAYSPGYGDGDGGTIRIAVEEDDGSGFPKGWYDDSSTRGGTGAALAYVDWVASATGDPGLYITHTFSSPPALVAGTRYHLVQTNIDATPTANYVSNNSSFVYGSVLSPRQPKWSDTEFGVNTKTYYGSWTLRGQYTPNVDLGYSNGAHQGNGYIGVTLTPNTIAGTTSMVRERFTVGGSSRAVSAAYVRVGRNSGTEDLTFTLEDSDGNTIDTATAATSSVPVLTGTADASAGIWISGSFSGSVVLAAGTTYNLRLSTGSSTSLWTRTIEQGTTETTYNPATLFSDGVLQYTTNSGSTWVNSSPSTHADMQFYLT